MSPGSDLAEISAEKLAASSLLPAHMRDNPVNTAVIRGTLAAYDLPITFLNFSETYVVEKKDKQGNVTGLQPGLHAALQRTIAWRHGWGIAPVSTGPDKAVVRIRHRAERGAGTLVEFTMDDARRARLPERNPTYAAYPDRMLFARAVTKAIMLVCPQVLRDAPPDVHLADVEEWDAIEAASSEAERVPDHVIDDEPEAYEGADEPTNYAPTDPTRPFE